jgi:hypothetical protein
MKTFEHLDSSKPLIWYSRHHDKSNKGCPYCARPLFEPEIPSDEEHLIGRKFVPKGSFGRNGRFNFQFRACRDCNSTKAERERHVSSVTLYSGLPLYDAEVRAIAINKASKDFHPDQKGTVVKDAHGEMKLVGNMGAMSMTLGMHMPPQLNPDYVQDLAFFHIQGLGSMISTRDHLTLEGMGIIPCGRLYSFGFFLHADWGNLQLAELTRRFRNLPEILLLDTAAGFFRTIICKDTLADEWYWILEWNKVCRVYGAVTKDGKRPRLYENLPEHKWNQMSSTRRMRLEIPIKDSKDDIFSHHFPTSSPRPAIST